MNGPRFVPKAVAADLESLADEGGAPFRWQELSALPGRAAE